MTWQCGCCCCCCSSFSDIIHAQLFFSPFNLLLHKERQRWNEMNWNELIEGSVIYCSIQCEFPCKFKTIYDVCCCCNKSADVNLNSTLYNQNKNASFILLVCFCYFWIMINDFNFSILVYFKKKGLVSILEIEVFRCNFLDL